MRRSRPAIAALASLLAAVTTFLSAGTADAGSSPVGDAGPPYDFVTELIGDQWLVPLKDQGMLTRTKHGYRFRTGQQSSHLVITRVKRGLRFRDRGTAEIVELSPACRERQVKVGVAAVCRVPSGITRAQPLLIEVWPRLGNDFTDSRALSAKFAVAVLADKGNDVAHFGPGPDYFNGYTGRDRVTGGGGKDWIRLGLGNDWTWAGPGDDYVLGQDGHDVIHGAGGDDRIGGNEGDDVLYGDQGADFIVCGDGIDATDLDVADRLLECENFLGN